MLYLKDQPVLILGLGASGLAMVRWCVKCGAQVTVADTREAPPQLAMLREQLPQVRFIGGPLEACLLQTGGQDGAQTVRAVFKSPGLTPAAVASVYAAAGAQGISTGGELTLFSQALKDLATTQAYNPKVLAITGTNGKTTVTSLTGQLVERCGKSVAVAGNIGPTLLDTLTQRLHDCTLPEVWVLELSSFQLHDLSSTNDFMPTAGTVLNVSQDHLDWHGDVQHYVADKACIFGAQGHHGWMLLNREDPLVMAMQPTFAKPIKAFGGTAKAAGTPRTVVCFGGDMPQRPGDFGIEVVNGMAWLVRAHEADETRRKRKEAADDVTFQRLMPADALRIRGRHNAVNALAALALTAAAGCAIGPALYALREYRGEPHRVESVAIVNEVEFFDDSKGTNVGATVAALKGLGEGFSGQRRLVVILGGDGKGQDFAPLATPVEHYVRAVVLIGRDAPLIRAALAGTGATLWDAASLPEAVQQANRRAHAGDMVLLSPACASFDMFTGYEHRARVFCDAVAALACDAGQAMESAS
jgi:UDP-N-acetylmuramoylalanine--D-glutamate ligase